MTVQKLDETTVRTSPGRQIQIGSHLYTVMGGNPSPYLLHRGIVPGTTWRDHKSCGGGCELSPGGV